MKKRTLCTSQSTCTNQYRDGPSALYRPLLTDASRHSTATQPTTNAATTNAATQPQTTLMFPLLAVASVGAFMGPRCVPAQAPRCVTAQAPRTMGPVAGIQLTPDEQWDIQQEISNLNMRLLSVEKSTEILAVNTNRTNAMVKMNMERNLKRNYDDVSRSPLLSPVPRARLATPDPRPPTPDPPPPLPTPRPTIPSLSGVESGTCGVCRRIPPL